MYKNVKLYLFKYVIILIILFRCIYRSIFFQIKNNTLIRNFAVKCWDNFDKNRIIKFVYDEFPEIKQVEDQSSSSIPDLLKGKSPEELAKICKLAVQAC